MIESTQITADHFVSQRTGLPDLGRWSELVEGVIYNWQGPAEEHGTIVMNLAKAVADFQQSIYSDANSNKGFALFDAGLLVQRSPDTVRYPTMSWFAGQAGFDLMDQPVIESRPETVIEIASTNDRRREMPDRIAGYQSWGVETIWLIDPDERKIYQFARQIAKREFSVHEKLTGRKSMIGFQIDISRVFESPE